jgi:hypothetical protein
LEVLLRGVHGRLQGGDGIALIEGFIVEQLRPMLVDAEREWGGGKM